MNDESQNTTDAEDRLVERGLSELLGGDAPPDLSERIFAAAKEQPLATLETGDSAMNHAGSSLISKKTHWAMFAAAASLFVAVGLLVADRQFDGLRRAEVTPHSEVTRESTTTDKQSSSETPKDDDMPLRQNVFHDEETSPIDSVSELDESSIVNPDSKVWTDLDRRKKFASVDLGAKAEDEAAAEAPRSSEESGPRGSLAGNDISESLESLSESPKPKEFFAATLSSVPANASRIGGRDSSLPQTTPLASTGAMLSMNANEARMIQQQINRKKSELLDIEITKELAIQRAKSSSALETDIQEEMSRDPMIQSVQQEQYAVQQKLTQLKAVTGRKNFPEIKQLQEQLGTLNQEVQDYQSSRETELRNWEKGKPNDRLAAVMREYTIERGKAETDLTKLNLQYKARIQRIHEQEHGRGPGHSGDQYTRIYENPFVEAQGEKAVSTFSIDVDTASYANVRQFLMQSSRLPPPDAVRLEELVNYFDYDYSGPTGDVPFAAHVETASCPWQPEHRLVRIGIKGREIERTARPQSNLVFLIDVSGSMNQPTKLPLLVEGMKMLTRELGENDRVAIVVYASSEGLALPSTRGDEQKTILAALEQLRAGGSTAGGAGIELAYQTAQDHFIKGGTNRVILCTDGDFNVGVTSTADLERMAEAKAKESGIFLTVLGFGRGNLNDAMMEAISGKGNGNYHYIDNQTEARKVLVKEMSGTLVTIAKDVKIQVEFNPAQIAGYRLLGYENRMLRTEDFNDDKKDAGEIGAGHTVTALYEIVPTGKSVGSPGVDPLKYQQTAKTFIDGPKIAELLTLKIRYKKPDGDTSTKLEFPITDAGGSFAESTGDFQFAAAVASFGMLLRNSEHRGNTSYAAVLEIAENGTHRDPHGYRAEFMQLVQRARQLAGE